MASPTVWDEDFQCYVHAAAVADASGGTADPIARAALASANAALKLARITGNDSNSTVESAAVGPTVYDAARQTYVFAAAITNPTGGSVGTVDAELRTAIVQILNALRGDAVIVGGSSGGPTVWDEDTSSYAFSAYTTPTGVTDITDANGRTQANAMAAAMRSAGLLTLD